MNWNKFFNRIFHDEHGKLVIMQVPNAPLLIWLICTLAIRFVSPAHHDIFSTIGTVALAVWALLEIVKGDAYIRRLLGLLVLVAIIARIFTR